MRAYVYRGGREVPLRRHEELPEGRRIVCATKTLLHPGQTISKVCAVFPSKGDTLKWRYEEDAVGPQVTRDVFANAEELVSFVQAHMQLWRQSL